MPSDRTIIDGVEHIVKNLPGPEAPVVHPLSEVAPEPAEEKPKE